MSLIISLVRKMSKCKVEHVGKLYIKLIKNCVSTTTQETNLMNREKKKIIENAVPDIRMFLLAFPYLSTTCEIV